MLSPKCDLALANNKNLSLFQEMRVEGVVCKQVFKKVN